MDYILADDLIAYEALMQKKEPKNFNLFKSLNNLGKDEQLIETFKNELITVQRSNSKKQIRQALIGNLTKLFTLNTKL